MHRGSAHWGVGNNDHGWRGRKSWDSIKDPAVNRSEAARLFAFRRCHAPPGISQAIGIAGMIVGPSRGRIAKIPHLRPPCIFSQCLRPFPDRRFAKDRVKRGDAVQSILAKGLLRANCYIPPKRRARFSPQDFHPPTPTTAKNLLPLILAFTLLDSCNNQLHGLRDPSSHAQAKATPRWLRAKWE